MLKIWTRTLMPVLVFGLLVACAKKNDSEPARVPRATTPTGPAPIAEPGAQPVLPANPPPTQNPPPGQNQGQGQGQGPGPGQMPPPPPADGQGPGQYPGQGEPCQQPGATHPCQGQPPPPPGQQPPAQPGQPPHQPGYPPHQPGQPPAQPGYPPHQPGQPPAQPGQPAPYPGQAEPCQRPGATQPCQGQQQPPQQSQNRYTGAGDDYMRQYLINKLNSVQDAGIRERNQAEANKITMARTNIDRTTGDVLISIQRVENGRTQNLRLAGTLTAEGIAQLSPISSAVAVKGSLICLDQDSRTCYTTRVRLEFGRPGHRGVVNIINRRTLANFDFHLPAEISRNLEFRKFLSLFMNTERRNGSYNSLREIMVDSFEVMNGRSGIKFSLISYENELIVAEGPLLAPANGGIATNIIMRRDPYLDDLVDLETRRGFKSNIHNSLSDVRLITNDGTRKFTLFMNVRPDEFNDQGSLSITFVRLHRGIMSMPQFQDLEKREQQ